MNIHTLKENFFFFVFPFFLSRSPCVCACVRLSLTPLCPSTSSDIPLPPPPPAPLPGGDAPSQSDIMMDSIEVDYAPILDEVPPPSNRSKPRYRSILQSFDAEIPVNQSLSLSPLIAFISQSTRVRSLLIQRCAGDGVCTAVQPSGDRADHSGRTIAPDEGEP